MMSRPRAAYKEKETEKKLRRRRKYRYHPDKKKEIELGRKKKEIKILRRGDRPLKKKKKRDRGAHPGTVPRPTSVYFDQ